MAERIRASATDGQPGQRRREREQPARGLPPLRAVALLREAARQAGLPLSVHLVDGSIALALPSGGGLRVLRRLAPEEAPAVAEDIAQGRGILARWA